jgi:hypothetical protein
MRPAICAICAIPCVKEPPPRAGDWLEFADYVDEGLALTHPEGVVYFCSKHVAVARLLTAKTLPAALADLKAQFADCPQYQEVPTPSLWQRLFSKTKND